MQNINDTERVEHIMSHFYFNDVQTIMEKSGWKWMACDGTPDVQQVRECAFNLLNKIAYLTDVEFISTGGFTAYRDKNNVIQLAFGIFSNF